MANLCFLITFHIVQIACEGNICAFYQNGPGYGNAGYAASKIRELINHGCSACGSAPTEPGNDVSLGQLTLNWVSDPRA